MSATAVATPQRTVIELNLAQAPTLVAKIAAKHERSVPLAILHYLSDDKMVEQMIDNLVGCDLVEPLKLRMVKRTAKKKVNTTLNGTKVVDNHYTEYVCGDRSTIKVERSPKRNATRIELNDWLDEGCNLVDLFVDIIRPSRSVPALNAFSSYFG